VGEHRDFKFGVQVDRNKSQPMNDKLSLKGGGHIKCPFLIFSPPPKKNIPRMA